MNSKFDIDPEFNMMNEMSADMSQKNYYAPKKFAVTMAESKSSTNTETDTDSGEDDGSTPAPEPEQPTIEEQDAALDERE